MQIQNNNTINFQANRILCTRKMLQNGNEDVIEVFKLNSFDKNFVERCYNAIELGETRCGKNRFINNLKKFFSDFRSIYAKKGWYDEFTHLIAVKNSEQIVGVAEINESCAPCSYLNKFTYVNNDKFIEKTLKYALITNAQNLTKKFGYQIFRRNALFSPELRGAENLFNIDDINTKKIPAKKYNSILSNIRRTAKDCHFKKISEKTECNLEEILGIKDFETDSF